jgi:hypothetical protein
LPVILADSSLTLPLTWFHFPLVILSTMDIASL